MLGDRVGLCREKIGTRELKVPEIIHTNTHTCTEITMQNHVRENTQYSQYSHIFAQGQKLSIFTSTHTQMITYI